MRHLLSAIALCLIVSCAAESDEYVFRNDIRPEYTKSMSIRDLADTNDADITLIDVRLAEDMASSPKLIDGAIYRDPEAITEWATTIPKNKPVVVYCVKGKWVSQKAATYLESHGYDVYNLAEGIKGWEAANKHP